jgi:hypothetical protein
MGKELAWLAVVNSVSDLRARPAVESREHLDSELFLMIQFPTDANCLLEAAGAQLVAREKLVSIPILAITRKTSTNKAKGKKNRPKTKLGIPESRTLESRRPPEPWFSRLVAWISACYR